MDAPAAPAVVVAVVGRLLIPSFAAPPPLILLLLLLLLLLTLAGDENWSNCWSDNKKTEFNTTITMVEIADRSALPLLREDDSVFIDIFYQRLV